ncbi:hypothetical protein GQX74_008897 [Glossina fuscipes]|nr:hypothetical protein GQX74_008897 [Glossina fuscipes]
MSKQLYIYLPPSRPLRFFFELLELPLLPPPAPVLLLLTLLPPPPPLAFVWFVEPLSLLFQRINILSLNTNLAMYACKGEYHEAEGCLSFSLGAGCKQHRKNRATSVRQVLKNYDILSSNDKNPANTTIKII